MLNSSLKAIKTIKNSNNACKPFRALCSKTIKCYSLSQDRIITVVAYNIFIDPLRITCALSAITTSELSLKIKTSQKLISH